jgi:superfamily II DNA or RNA helicase
MISLRPKQNAFVCNICEAIDGGERRIMGQGPTGFGKTRIAGWFAERTLARRQRMIFTVPALSLIDQTVERFYAMGIRDIGVIQADHPLTNYARPIQVASVQTLQRRDIPRAHLVMIDEAHRLFDFYNDWMANPEWSDVPFVGLSATPWTRGLGKHFHQLIIATTIQELIDDGDLSPFRVFAPSSPDLSGVRTVAGDYHEGDLSQAVNKDALVADIVSTWCRRAEGRPTLCFAVDRAHAKHLQKEFQVAGIPTAYIDAYTPAVERKLIERLFHAGDVKVVCNVGCLTTGVDWDVRCILLARPTKSEMLFVQIIGRGLRTADGKDDCLILDHSDTHSRLGFVTDILHDELDDGKARGKAKPRDKPLPKPCPSCSFLKPPKVSTCPSCGFAPKPVVDYQSREGELVELTRRREERAAADAAQQVYRQFYAEALGYAMERSQNPGRAFFLCREKFGFSAPMSWRSMPPATPSPETRSWIKSRDIAFAKGRAKAGA